MPDACLLVLALLSSAVGMAWLALAMEVHWQQARGTGTGPGRRRVVALRALGTLALLQSLLLCLQADHATMAVLVWIMSLAASACGVAQMLAWRPRSLGWLVAWLPWP